MLIVTFVDVLCNFVKPNEVVRLNQIKLYHRGHKEVTKFHRVIKKIHFYYKKLQNNHLREICRVHLKFYLI